MSAFDYGSADSWDIDSESSGLLPVGSHVCTITEVDNGTSSNNHPQIELQVEDANGRQRRDWVVITPRTVGKVAMLFDSAGAERPQQGEFDPNSGALTDACVARLKGKKIGVVVRLEDSFRNPGTQEPRIAGYVEPARITDDAPADTRGMNAGASAAAAADEKVPF